MLTCLRVRNLAIIDQLEVEFGPGLNVVTGQTGAGKSILVTALQLVLGARARPELVRTGAERAEVEALFELQGEPAMVERLRALDVQAESELVVRRVVSAGGRSRAYLNGRLATLAQLRELAAGLVDISSQHQHHTLVEQSTHRGFLDAYGQLEGLLAQVSSAFAALSQARAEHQALARRVAERVEREDLLRFQLAELDRVDPKPGELGSLGVERDRLQHGEQLAASAAQAEHIVYGGDGAVCERLGAAIDSVEQGARLDGSLGELAQRLHSARTDLEDIGLELGRYRGRLDAEPERLHRIEERLHELSRLVRRHGGSLQAVIEHRERAQAELDDLQSLDDDLLVAAERVSALLDQVGGAARELSAGRSKAAGALSVAITSQLRQLGMGQAQVQVQVAAAAPDDRGPVIDGARLTANGLDRVEFLIAPNPGEAPRSLARVASGGELSRALLAMKCVLASVGPVGLYVFDEVDAGVGGAVGEVIGVKIRDVANHHQVLCITHLPQIAAYAQAHFVVSKGVHDDGRTRSRVSRLDAAGQEAELARMLGGVQVSEQARAMARELLAVGRG